MDHKVIIYTSDQCSKSQILKNYLDEWNVAYEERNVNENQQYLQELQDQGIYATPTVFIGEQIFQGLLVDRIKQELNI
ncbi:glutaredoxin family protein [Aquisalibacillus elongatus]|uniref:Ribonucleoside-diphosphate reductase class Ib glutaredoxin subunit n=1 Tax=Aquisalibacillus elongatus TaxID=485577 RepID=A0A3N5BH15_9BACI|nr:glutaredoxin family protein [Aquisalibacillus elongatus]RPF57084.1 ribonucleoside-diphosphate reductase class Ib glutaredoxin subunit [Aquisalibacillus elongatus]